jgi:CBS domain-containing protein
MSPRAAWRLESLGFPRVHDYVAGKADWGSAGLPLDGTSSSATRVAAYVRTDVPTCRLGDDLEAMRRRVRDAEWDTCFVVADGGVVLGRLGRAAINSDDATTIEEAMTSGPSTIRPSARLEDVVARMHKQELTSLPVTSSDGRLIGLLVRADAERAIAR